MRLDSPAVLATSGTLAIHVLLAVFSDAMVVTHPPELRKPVPHVELVDIEPPPILMPPPPPVAEPVPEIKPEPKPVEHVQKIVRREPPLEQKSPPPETHQDPNPSGGAPVTSMPDVVPAATGVPVAVGARNTGRVGRGGNGTGTGAGLGPGSASAPPTPVSVATIKTRAMPRGDFSYWDAGKAYPAEAKALGVEGVIKVRLIVDEHGKVRSTILLNKLGHGLDEMALHRAAAIEFEPARDTNDQPVSSVVVWTFTMELPK